MEELRKGELFNINEENDCDEKNERYARGNDAAEKLYIKETLGDNSQHWQCKG